MGMIPSHEALVLLLPTLLWLISLVSFGYFSVPRYCGFGLLPFAVTIATFFLAGQ